MHKLINSHSKIGLTKIVQRLKADRRGKELLFELVDEPSVYALWPGPGRSAHAGQPGD